MIHLGFVHTHTHKAYRHINIYLCHIFVLFECTGKRCVRQTKRVPGCVLGLSFRGCNARKQICRCPLVQLISLRWMCACVPLLLCGCIYGYLYVFVCVCVRYRVDVHILPTCAPRCTGRPVIRITSASFIALTQ